MYPTITDALPPEAATGLMFTLGLWLESFEDVEVFPVLAQLPESGVWDSRNVGLQFSPEDWSLEEIQEDAAIWGVLERVGQGWRWTLNLEDDLNSDDETITKTLEAGTLSEVITGASQLARELVGTLQGTERTAPQQLAWPEGDERSTSALSAIGIWYVFALEAVCTETLALSPTGQQFAKSAQQADSPGMTWATAAGWVFGIVLISAGRNIQETIDPETFILSLPHFAYGAVPIAALLIRASAPDVARRLLGRATEDEPEYWPSWLMLAQLYVGAGRPELAVDAFHRAFENGAEHARLLMAYASVLQGYRKQGMVLRQVILIDDPEADATRTLLREMLAAYNEAVALAPFLKAQCLAESLPLWMELGEPDALAECMRGLVEIDLKGEWLNTGLQDVLGMDDLEAVTRVLEQGTRQFPERFGVWRALAIVLNATRNRKGSVAAANTARKLAGNATERGEMEFLALIGQNPKIEVFMAEILQDMGTDAEISDDAFETLEMIVEQAPHYAEAHLALAGAYRATEEDEAALEVLLEAEKRLPHSTEIALALGELLRDLEELTTAIDYVRKGLVASPDSVPLLALAAELTLDVGDEEAAHALLSRAQVLSAFHPDVLRAARRFLEDGD